MVEVTIEDYKEMWSIVRQLQARVEVLEKTTDKLNTTVQDLKRGLK